MRGLSLVVASGAHSSLWCVGLSLSCPLLLWGTGSRHAGSVVVAHGPSCSAACGIFPDQGSNPCPLHWQADSQPLCHQGSPIYFLYSRFLLVIRFIHISVYMSIPISQFITPPPPPHHTFPPWGPYVHSLYLKHYILKHLWVAVGHQEQVLRCQKCLFDIRDINPLSVKCCKYFTQSAICF